MQENLPQVDQNQSIVLSLKDNYLKIYTPENCLKFVGKLKNIEMAIDAHCPSLSHIRKLVGVKSFQALLMLWLVYLNDMLNLKSPMTPEQIRLCAQRMGEDFSYLKISELSYIFNQIITGQYGELYQNLSIAKVLNCLREYEKERFNFAEERSLREHYEFRYQEAKNETLSDIFYRKNKKYFR